MLHMKNYLRQVLVTGSFMLTLVASSQNMNWENPAPAKHLVYVGAGADYGVVYHLGYAYKIRSHAFPAIAHIEYSFPSGNKLVDDYKVKIGGQVRLLKLGHVHLTAKVDGVFRRFENDFARLLNFGSDMSGVLGYYRTKWFIAGEAGFDKAIVTNFRQSAIYKNQYAGAQDGWYEPATGGNFYYGLQGGISFGRHDLTLKVGRVLVQDFKSKPLFPYYGALSYMIRF